MSDLIPPTLMRRNSPLYRQLGEPGAVKLSERAFCGHLNLRGRAADPAFAAAVKSALGVELPTQPNTVARRGDIALCWLGPDEWLVLTPPELAARVQADLQAALAGQFCALTDISEGQTIVVLAAGNSCDILARGCPLDFHPRAFPVGSCAQSVMAKAGVLLLREDQEAFAIVVRRSFAPYLYHVLQDAAAMAAA